MRKNLFFCTAKSLGFTLIELLVVIAVLGVLAGGVLVAINPLKRINQANDSKIKSDIGQIANASQAYYVTNLSYPKTVKQLVNSDNLKIEPRQPKTDDIYTITTTPDTCDGTSSNACTDITIEAPLSAPQATGGNHTWSSVTGQAGEIVPPTPTPTTTPIPTATPTPTPDPLEINLVGYWNIEEGAGTTTLDRKNNQNGSLQNGTSWSLDHINKNSTKSVSFNGINNTIQIGSSNILNPVSITISFWAKASIITTGQAQYQRIISKSSQYEVILFQGFSSGFAGRLQFKILGGTVDIADTTAGVFTNNQWNHIVAVYNSETSTGSIYVNGAIKNSRTTTPIPRSLTTTSNALYIGSGSNNYYFNGLIDKVRIYNTPLNQATITQLHNEGL